jgi:hypothetical protein
MTARHLCAPRLRAVPKPDVRSRAGRRIPTAAIDTMIKLAIKPVIRLPIKTTNL